MAVNTRSFKSENPTLLSSTRSVEEHSRRAHSPATPGWRGKRSLDTPSSRHALVSDRLKIMARKQIRCSPSNLRWSMCAAKPRSVSSRAGNCTWHGSQVTWHGTGPTCTSSSTRSITPAVTSTSLSSPVTCTRPRPTPSSPPCLQAETTKTPQGPHGVTRTMSSLGYPTSRPRR
jgi:hypothetical protein